MHMVTKQRASLKKCVHHRSNGYTLVRFEIELHPNNMNREDGLVLSRSWKPLITPWKHVESPPYRSSWYICPSQDNSAPRLTYRHFPPTLLPSRSSTRPFQGLSCIQFTSSVDTPLSLFYFHHPHTAIGLFPAYRLPPQLTTSSLDTYKTSIPLSLGLLIPDDGGSTHLWNVGRQSFYTAVQPRRQLW
jgi:hypothetical protein